MRNGRKNLQVILVAVILLLVGLSVGFAALSTTLNITTSTVKQEGSSVVSWNIGFQGTSATPTSTGTSTTGRSCDNATVTSSSVTINNATLSKPGDKCVYALTIKNSGTIAGSLGSVTPTKPTSTTCTVTAASSTASAKMVCGNLTYTLSASNDDSTKLTTGSTLAASGTKAVYLILEYTGTTLNSSTVTQQSGSFAIVYNQA